MWQTMLIREILLKIKLLGKHKSILKSIQELAIPLGIK